MGCRGGLGDWLEGRGKGTHGLCRRSSSSGPILERAMAEKALDAIAFLKADHREIEDLFAKIEKRDTSRAEKKGLIEEVCRALIIHAQLEEEIAYPAFREADVK